MTDNTERDARAEIAGEISGVVVGHGYGSTTIGISAALEAADLLIAAGYEKREPVDGPAHVGIAVAARGSGKTRALIDALLDRANERGVAVEIIEPEREPVVVDDATEWEYAVREVRHEGPFTDVYASLDEMREDFDVSDWPGPLAGEGEEVVRRRKAGPWSALTPDGQEATP